MNDAPAPPEPGHRPYPSPPTPIQPSWTGPPADARIECVLARIDFLSGKAADLAAALHARAMQQLAATPQAAPIAARAPARPAATRHPEAPDQDLCLSFARLFHLVTRAGTVETAIAERRRTQDQRDRLADHRANGAAEQARRTCAERNVRALVAAAAAAIGRPPEAYQQILNQRMFDHDTAAMYAGHTAAEIAAVICRDLGIPPLAASSASPPPASPSTTSPSPASGLDDPSGAEPEDLETADVDDPAIGSADPDLMSTAEMDVLLRAILTHPSLDRPPPAATHPP